MPVTISTTRTLGRFDYNGFNLEVSSLTERIANLERTFLPYNDLLEASLSHQDFASDRADRSVPQSAVPAFVLAAQCNAVTSIQKAWREYRKRVFAPTCRPRHHKVRQRSEQVPVSNSGTCATCSPMSGPPDYPGINEYGTPWLFCDSEGLRSLSQVAASHYKAVATYTPYIDFCSSVGKISEVQ